MFHQQLLYRRRIINSKLTVNLLMILTCSVRIVELLSVNFLCAVFSTLGIYLEELDPDKYNFCDLSEQKFNICIRSL